ncbi:hypothetical protein [Pseudonocardia acidicola]|uniref:Excreted virulence factor EspC (Type VII ESX diderm) n=1 Tax=Pseudonocardia acidicola TaxID=2724939 RepID=A0ABX1SFS3_9PSEU|nr:hypothetical protein [Pseudonocardia acidicola]NMI00407.1 hypothetical protein [Pseudonocardia acidicola]
MPPDVHLDPHRLRVHAGRLAEALDALRPVTEPDAVLGCLRAPAASGLHAELDRLVTVLIRAGNELAELSGTLWAVAAEAEDADRGVGGSLTRLVADLR